MIDTYDLTRDLDRTKSTVFLSKSNAAFLGSLMCSLNFKWDESLPTCGTDSIDLLWNPNYFKRLTPASRTTELQHELWHVALLHNVRRGSRHKDMWNIACDIRIDLMLEHELGCTFEGIDGVDRDVKYIGWTEEDIYDDLIKNPPPDMKCTCCSGSMDDSPEKIRATINTVVQAMHQAKLSQQAGNLPGVIQETLNKFLEPVIAWQSVLMKFFTDLLDEDSTWARPNRRYEDMYLPSRFLDDGRLEHLIYYLDVSMSVSQQDVLRFNSEVKYIQEILKPKKLTLVQFDTQIQDEKVFEEDEPFNEIKVTGRGGTCLVCVRDHIQKHKPTAAIIFSDMYVAPMQPLDQELPVIWISIGNKQATVPFGKLIHID